MNKIEELRNYADNLRIKNEVKNDTLKRYKNLVDKLTLENKRLKKENKELIELFVNIKKFNSDIMDLNIIYSEEIERLKGEKK